MVSSSPLLPRCSLRMCSLHHLSELRLIISFSDQTCWEIPAGAQASFGTATGGGLTTYTMSVPMRLKSGAGCGGGGSDRGWVVAFIVILILWGAGLGLFALITCKIDSCYSMVRIPPHPLVLLHPAHPLRFLLVVGVEVEDRV